MKLKAVDDTFLSCPTYADIAKSTRERPAQKRDLKIISQTIKSRCPRNHQNRRSAVDMLGVSGRLDTSRKVGQKVEDASVPFAFMFCDIPSAS